MAVTGILGTADSTPGNIVLGLAGGGGGGGPTVIPVNVSESLGLTETASYPRVDVSLSESISFSETLTAGRRVNVSVSEAIIFSESDPVIGPQYREILGRLNLHETADGHLSYQNVTVEEVMVLIDLVGRRFGVSVSEVLSLVESTMPHPDIAEVLALIEAIAVAKLQGSSDVLDWSETASVTGAFGRLAADTMTLIEAAHFFLSNPSLECTYSPMIGAYSGSDYTAPPVSAPTLGDGILTLTYPYSSPTTTLVLRNPEWGNQDKQTYNRLNQITRGGTLTVFADPNWPKFKTRSFQLTAIPDDKRDSLLQFLEDSLGQEIGLLDWDNRQWRGIITNPDTAVSQAGDCDHQVSIEFEGDLA